MILIAYCSAGTLLRPLFLLSARSSPQIYPALVDSFSSTVLIDPVLGRYLRRAPYLWSTAEW